MLHVLQRMHDRYLVERQDSDVAAFQSLLLYGELLTKAVTGCFVACIADDSDRARYSLVFDLVRADGIGDWDKALQQVLAGSASHHLQAGARSFQRDLTERMSPGTWQYEVVEHLQRVCWGVGVQGASSSPGAVTARSWFQLFVQLRNKTRGHGATPAREQAAVLRNLEASILLLRDSLSILRVPIAYLHRNLSGKYRVTALGDDVDPFAYLRSRSDVSLLNGVYVHLEMPLFVDLMVSDSDASDIFLPNGQFRDDTFEVLSYSTGERRRVDGSSYTRPAGRLPDSESHGAHVLDVIGRTFSNIPPSPENYISRPLLEADLARALSNDRHEIVSLSGPGGAGKTSTALQVINQLVQSETCRFECAVWFSARDIDLELTGPKVVRPRGVSIDDFAAEYVSYAQPPAAKQKGFSKREYFATALTSSPLGPTLFVFDNFETVADARDLYRWLDTHVRAPNKILVTTRMRDFAGDLPIEVRGMTDEEAEQLVAVWSSVLGVTSLMTPDYVSALIREADGHPYVLKILLGEVERAGRALKPERIVASRDDILQALFERTYATLHPLAQRVFLLLCSWRSAVPAVCIEAVILGSTEERVDVVGAIDVLRRLSLVDEVSAPDGQSFVLVPLVASVFGRRKLAAHPYRLAIEADSRLLQLLGPTSREQIRQGVEPKLHTLVRTIAASVAAGTVTLESQLPLLEFLAGKIPSVWTSLAILCEEQGDRQALERAAGYLRRLIEVGPEEALLKDAWWRLASLCNRLGDDEGHVLALVTRAEIPGVDIDSVSGAANVLNTMLRNANKVGRPLLSPDARRYSLEHLAQIMLRRIEELNGTGYSRLAWLLLNLSDEQRASEVVRKGLSVEPENTYLRALSDRGVG